MAIKLYKSQKEISRRIAAAVPEIIREERQIRKHGRWHPNKEEPIIENVCQKYGILQLTEHVRKIKNGDL